MIRAEALSLALISSQAQASDLTVTAGTMICPSLEATASKTHPGCYLARGGQRVEIIAALTHYAQVRLWSTNGAESSVAWTTRAAADHMQIQEAKR